MNWESSEFEQQSVDVPFDEVEALSSDGATSLSYKVRIWGKWFFLKRPKPEFADNPVYLAAFEKEFDLGIRLDHPNIVRYHSKGRDAHGVYILMEYVDGETLTKYIRQHPKLSKSEALRIIDEIAEGLKYLHARQIVHFDLKPDNILITANGHHVKLIDLGFAYSDCYSAIACGTHAYSAPEQFASPQSASLRADVFALGNVIKYITPSFAGVVHRAIRSNPDERYPSIEALMHDLQRRRGRRYLAIAVGVCGIILFGVFGGLFLQHSAQSSDEPLEDAPIRTQQVEDATTESAELSRFRQAIRVAHKQAFTRYYASVTEINDANYNEAVRLCADCFNQARAMEDSLRNCYMAQHPSMEQDLNVVIEQEMAATMSKHLSMLNAYNQHSMNK